MPAVGAEASVVASTNGLCAEPPPSERLHRPHYTPTPNPSGFPAAPSRRQAHRSGVGRELAGQQVAAVGKGLVPRRRRILVLPRPCLLPLLISRHPQLLLLLLLVGKRPTHRGPRPRCRRRRRVGAGRRERRAGQRYACASPPEHGGCGGCSLGHAAVNLGVLLLAQPGRAGEYCGRWEL